MPKPLAQETPKKRASMSNMQGAANNSPNVSNKTLKRQTSSPALLQKYEHTKIYIFDPAKATAAPMPQLDPQSMTSKTIKPDGLTPVKMSHETTNLVKGYIQSGQARVTSNGQLLAARDLTQGQLALAIVLPILFGGLTIVTAIVIVCCGCAACGGCLYGTRRLVSKAIHRKKGAEETTQEPNIELGSFTTVQGPGGSKTSRPARPKRSPRPNNSSPLEGSA